MHLSALLQFAVSTDCSIREYQSIFILIIKHVKCRHSTPTHYAGIFDALSSR